MRPFVAYGLQSLIIHNSKSFRHMCQQNEYVKLSFTNTLHALLLQNNYMYVQEYHTMDDSVAGRQASLYPAPKPSTHQDLRFVPDLTSSISSSLV